MSSKNICTIVIDYSLENLDPNQNRIANKFIPYFYDENWAEINPYFTPFVRILSIKLEYNDFEISTVGYYYFKE